MRKRKYELINRLTNERQIIIPKDMTRIFSSPMVHMAARLNIGDMIEYSKYMILRCIH